MTKADSSKARENIPCLPPPILVELFSHNETTFWGVLADSYTDNTRPAAAATTWVAFLPEAMCRPGNLARNLLHTALTS